jgi:YidC/Oxa1 family membrane protein insertase
MLAFGPIDAAVGVAHDLVMRFAATLLPLTGAGSGAAAIILFTMLVRLALLPLTVRQIRGERARARISPRLAELREEHGDDREAFGRAYTELVPDRGRRAFAGCLPAIAQGIVLMGLYAAFTWSTVDGSGNELLQYQVFGASLGERWSSFGVFGAADLVFYGLFAVLAALAWWTSTRLRARMGDAGAPMARVLALLPFGTVVAAAWLPLAAGLYLATSTAWTATERALLTRRPV